MLIPFFICALIAAGLLSACSSSDKTDSLLEEAAQYHNQATNIQEVVEPKIEQIDSLKTAFEEWEENLVEVPGMPHNHSHEHGKHEHHADAILKDLPAEQMRDLQRETFNNIRQIQARLVTALKPV